MQCRQNGGSKAPQDRQQREDTSSPSEPHMDGLIAVNTRGMSQRHIQFHPLACMVCSATLWKSRIQTQSVYKFSRPVPALVAAWLLGSHSAWILRVSNGLCKSLTYHQLKDRAQRDTCHWSMPLAWIELKCAFDFSVKPKQLMWWEERWPTLTSLTMSMSSPSVRPAS